MPAYKPVETAPNNVRDLILSIGTSITGASRFKKFQRLYNNDRIAFVYDILPDLGKTITSYQLEILGYFDSGIQRVAVRGPHGLGKTFLAATLIHHAVLTSEADAKIPTTASAWRQLEKYLWPEVHKLAKFINWTRVGREPYDQRKEFLQDSIRLPDGPIEAFAVASDDHNTIEGAHGSLLFYIFDEAKAIPRNTWNAAEGAFSTAGLVIPSVESEMMEGISQSDMVGFREGNSNSTIENDYGGSEMGVNYNDVFETYGGMEVEVSDEKLGMDRGSSKGVVYSVDGIANRENAVWNDGWNMGMAVGDSKGEIMGSSRNGGNKELLPHHNLPSTTRQNASKPTNKSQTKKSPTKKSPIEIANLSNTYKAMAFAISTPGDPSGQFYDIHMHKPGYEDWTTRHVTLDEAIAAGRISKEWAEQRAKQWSVDSAIYQNRVLGEFADMSDEGIIPLSWIRAACERWKNGKSKNFAGMLDGKLTLGVDTARAGDDKTVLALRSALVIESLQVFSKLSTMAVCGQIHRFGDGRYIHIETDGGIGAAVYDRLKEQGFPQLRPIIVGGKTTFMDKSRTLRFGNVRSAMWWNMRELLDPLSGEEVCLVPHQDLILDLCTPMYEIRSDGVVYVESKDSIGKRIGRSTDYGDAVCLAFWFQSSGGGMVL